MRMQATAAGAIWLVMASCASAQDTGLSDALNLWLTGNDEAAIPALAKDAQAGDLGAQLILGQVDRDTLAGGYSDYLLSIKGPGRAEALRAKTADGDSINWLLVLSDADKAALGDALFWYEAHLDPIESALKLQLQSETVAAQYVLWNTLNNGYFDKVNSLPADNFGLSDTGFLVWLRDYFAQSNKSISISSFLADTSPYKVQGILALKRLERVLSNHDVYSVGVTEFITVMQGKGMTLPETTDLVTLNATIKQVAAVDPALGVVDRMCSIGSDSDNDYQCVIQTMEIIGGYKTLLGVRTPSETAVPAATYYASDRAVTALRDVVRGRAPDASKIRSTSIAGIIAGTF